MLDTLAGRPQPETSIKPAIVGTQSGHQTLFIVLTDCCTCDSQRQILLIEKQHSLNDVQQGMQNCRNRELVKQEQNCHNLIKGCNRKL